MDNYIVLSQNILSSNLTILNIFFSLLATFLSATFGSSQQSLVPLSKSAYAHKCQPLPDIVSI